MTQGIDRISDTLGFLVLNEDGAVIESGGELENEEKLADQLMNLLRTAIKIPTAGDRPANFKRLSVLWKSFIEDKLYRQKLKETIPIKIPAIMFQLL